MTHDLELAPPLRPMALVFAQETNADVELAVARRNARRVRRRIERGGYYGCNGEAQAELQDAMAWVCEAEEAVGKQRGLEALERECQAWLDGRGGNA